MYALSILRVHDDSCDPSSGLEAQEVIIQAQALLHPSTGLLHRNVWITVIEGIRGICAFDEHGIATAYMVLEPSTDYYQIMSKSRMMPRLLGEAFKREGGVMVGGIGA
jgi:hypothetical protein